MDVTIPVFVVTRGLARTMPTSVGSLVSSSEMEAKGAVAIRTRESFPTGGGDSCLQTGQRDGVPGMALSSHS